MEESIEKKANKTLIIGGLLIAVIVVGLFTNGFGLFHKNTTGEVINQGGDFIPLSIGNSPVLGNSAAPVTMYIFSDFSCPYCFRFEQDTFPMIREDYVDTGKMKIVFKYTSGHGTGEASHLVALAMNEQNLFWQFHNAAFEHQEDTGDLAKMKTLAESLGANMTKLEQDLATHDYRQQLQDDNAMSTSNGVQGTPSFIINGKLISGAQPYSVFKKAIDAELK